MKKTLSNDNNVNDNDYQDNYIMFTDATMYISERVDELKKYLDDKIKDEYDLVLATDRHNHVSKNIGVLLIRCNEKMLHFWENCLTIMKTKMELGENVHDQAIVNTMLNSGDYSSLKTTLFESNRVVCNNELVEELRDDFYIFKMTVRLDIVSQGHTSHKQRLYALFYARFITEQELWENM